LIYRRDSILFQ